MERTFAQVALRKGAWPPRPRSAVSAMIRIRGAWQRAWPETRKRNRSRQGSSRLRCNAKAARFIPLSRHLPLCVAPSRDNAHQRVAARCGRKAETPRSGVVACVKETPALQNASDPRRRGKDDAQRWPGGRGSERDGEWETGLALDESSVRLSSSTIIIDALLFLIYSCTQRSA